jgi:phosphoglycolate phosphatase
MKKIVLFDFDGTIADSVHSIFKIFNILAKKYSFTPIEEKDIDSLRGETVSSLFKRLHVPMYKLPLLAIDTKQLQSKEIPFIKPIDGIKKALDDLKSAGYTLGILTSNGKQNVEDFLKRNDLEVFEYITSDSSLFGKDTVINKFMKKNTVEKSQLIYIGDEIRDVEACKKISVDIIAVTWGFNSKEALQKFKPNYLIDSPSALLPIMNAIK